MKQETIIHSIPPRKAAKVAKRFGLSVEQVFYAFNIFDNCVEAGEWHKMSTAQMADRIKECIGISLQAKNPLVWKKLAIHFKFNYDELRRKRW